MEKREHIFKNIIRNVRYIYLFSLSIANVSDRINKVNCINISKE